MDTIMHIIIIIIFMVINKIIQLMCHINKIIIKIIKQDIKIMAITKDNLTKDNQM
jgi:hypothetical protein